MALQLSPEKNEVISIFRVQRKMSPTQKGPAKLNFHSVWQDLSLFHIDSYNLLTSSVPKINAF